MSPTPRITPGTIAVRVGNETVVWVERTGALHLLDPVATAVLDLVDGDRPLAEVTTLLADRFGTDTARIAADVDRLVHDFRSAQVLAWGST